MTSLTVRIDTASVQQQVAEVLQLLERLPDGVREALLEGFTNLSDFRFETEIVPAVGAGPYILRFRSVALADLCAAALEAMNGGGPKV